MRWHVRLVYLPPHVSRSVLPNRDFQAISSEASFSTIRAISESQMHHDDVGRMYALERIHCGCFSCFWALQTSFVRTKLG
jgi:hypothetical protein